jgi:hypothetical protein
MLESKGGELSLHSRILILFIYLLGFMVTFGVLYAATVLRAHSKITSHFIRRCITSNFKGRCIPPGCVAKAWNLQIIPRFRALPAGRRNA